MVDSPDPRPRHRPYRGAVSGRFLRPGGLSRRAAGAQPRDLKPVATGVYPRNTTAVKTALLDLRAGDPGAVILVGAYQPVAALIAWARHIGFEPVFITISFVGSNALVRGTRTGRGRRLRHPGRALPDGGPPALWRPPIAGPWRRTRPDARPGFVSFEGYLAGRLAIVALELCGPGTRSGLLSRQPARPGSRPPRRFRTPLRRRRQSGLRRRFPDRHRR